MAGHLTPSRPVTSADVGRAAGVSRSTVSLVLNDAPGQSIPESTRERVRRAAAELGYVPNGGAAALRRGRSSTVLIPSPPGQLGALVSQWIDEIEGVLEGEGFSVLMYGDRYASGDRAVRRWLSLRPLAVLTLGGRDLGDDAVAALHAGGVRTVLMTDTRARPGAHVFRLDHAAVGRLAVSHLIEGGRDAIGVVVPQEPLLRDIALRRWGDLQEIAAGRSVSFLEASLDEPGAARVAEQIIDTKLDGVAAFNDDYALLALAGLVDRGIRVPDDVALVGTDNRITSALSRPSLTSIEMSLPAPAEILALLKSDAAADGVTSSVQELPPPRLVRRGSS